MKVDFVTEKGSGTENEDALLVGKSVFAVFDGSAGGYLASHVAKSVFERGGEPLHDLALTANREIGVRGGPARAGGPGTTVAAVQVGRQNFSWLRAGGSAIIGIAKDGTAGEVGDGTADGGLLDGSGTIPPFDEGTASISSLAHLLLLTGRHAPEDLERSVDIFLAHGLRACVDHLHQRKNGREDTTGIAIAMV